MKFCWCTLSVKDMEKSAAFYRDVVGLPVARRFKAGPVMEICFLGEGDTEVELISGPDRPPSHAPEGISLGFEVKSLDETMEFIKSKGLNIESGPFQPNPHVKFFFVKDPDGFSVQFVENT